MEVLSDIQPEPLAERIVVRVHRGGRHRARAAAAGVSDAQTCHKAANRGGLVAARIRDTFVCLPGFAAASP